MNTDEARVAGDAKAMQGRFSSRRAIVGHDHTASPPIGHAPLLGVVNPGIGPRARVAVEPDIASGTVLAAQIRVAIGAADPAGIDQESHPSPPEHALPPTASPAR